MTVIAIIAILAGLVTSAASAAIRQSRKSRADAMKAVLQNGIAAYYAKEGEWPGSSLDGYAQKGEGGHTITQQRNGYVILTDSEAQQTFREVVSKSISSATPYLDVTGLFVAKNADPSDTKSAKLKHAGMDFRNAVRRSERNASALGAKDLYFGYPDRKTGKFKQYRIRYNFRSDSIKVLKQEGDE